MLGLFRSGKKPFKRIILVWGEPEQGKTSVCSSLRDQFHYEVCTLDLLYVDFIKTAYPELYFDRLRLYIRPHYDSIFAPDIKFPGTDTAYTDHLMGKDVRGHWRSHILDVIHHALSATDCLAVEGYLLTDCRDYLTHALRADRGVRVIQALVENRNIYRTDQKDRRGPLTLQQLIDQLD